MVLETTENDFVDASRTDAKRPFERVLENAHWFDVGLE